MCATIGASTSPAGAGVPTSPVTGQPPPSPEAAVASTLRYQGSTSFRPAAAMLSAPKAAVALWLWLPHVGVGVLILVVLFVDFLAYRRRQRLQMHRQQERQELHEMFPKRVIGGVYRSLGTRPTPVAQQSPGPRDPSTGGSSAASPSATSPSPNGTQALSGAAGQKNARKKQKKVLDVLQRQQQRKAAATPDATAPASPGKGPPDSAAAGETTRRAMPNAPTTLQKRESSRKLPPINGIGGRFEHGFAEKEVDRVSPSLAEEADRGDLSMA